MVRALLPRLPILRALYPRVAAPILPVSRLSLTSTAAPIASRLLHYSPARRSPSPTSPRALTAPAPDPRSPLPPNASLSQRLKHLIKSYGWYALGVYFVFSVLDFGVAFIGVNLLGAEYVSHVAAVAKSAVANILHSKPAEPGRDEMDSISSPSAPGQEGLYAIIVLAYTIHKTLFFPIRIGLTAAFTPRLVGWLSRRGWAGTAGTRRAANEMRERLRERRRSRGGED